MAVEIVESWAAPPVGAWGASHAGATEFRCHHYVLRRGRRLYDAVVSVERASRVPPVHGAPSTEPPAVRHVEITTRPSGTSARGAVWSELRNAATAAALGAAS